MSQFFIVPSLPCASLLSVFRCFEKLLVVKNTVEQMSIRIVEQCRLMQVDN